MNQMKKQDIILMENHELINAFERLVVEITKATNFSSRGISPKLIKQYDWVKEEILVRMK